MGSLSSTSSRRSRKPKLAVWKFAGCDGCQLTLLDCEDELLAIAGQVEFAHFLELSRAVVRGPYDLSIIEGSITTPRHVDLIQRIRRQSKLVIAIGACATAGGIQALRNFGDVREFAQVVYASPEYIHSLDQSLPASAYVTVDFELRGCSPNKAQLLELLSALLKGRKPNIPTHSVCVECKRKGIVCIMVAEGTPCLGPVTQAGCGALCPSYRRGCFGCFGPMETPNTASHQAWLGHLGTPPGERIRLYRSFNAYAARFREASEREASESNA